MLQLQDKEVALRDKVEARLLSARDWLSGPRGQRLIEQESQLLASLLPGLRGRHACCLGVLPDPRLFNGASGGHCVFLTPLDAPSPGQQSLPRIRLALEEWPVLPHSMHLVVLHHTLEFTRKPHALLREACQTIAPGGRMVIVGFNSRNLWNPTRLLATGTDRILRKARFYTPARLKDWLALLGLHTCDLRFGGSAFCLPGLSAGPAGQSAGPPAAKKHRRLSERLGLGSFYVLSAVKERQSMIPCRPYRPGTAPGHRLLGSVACTRLHDTGNSESRPW